MSKVLAVLAGAILLPSGAIGQKVPGETHSCEGLAQLELTEGKIVSAQAVAAGAFAPTASATPWLVGDACFYKTVPSFCRVVVEATPSADSDIKIEVWMPVSGWNGKFQGQGNGGFASAGTNTGHSGGGTDASWALGHPEKVKDFGYRGIHEMTRIAQAAIRAYFGTAAQHSYFDNCSNGGRQALMEVQRFPEDYEGVIAGAPANFWTHLLTKALSDAQTTTLDSASYIPSSKLPTIAQAVNSACDAQDGVADEILNDPRQCRFDPAMLLCKEGDSEKCLTAPQITALKKLYQGPQDSRGKQIFPGYLPGAEEGPGGWAPWITGPAPEKSLLFAFAVGYFSNIVYEKADWNYKEARVEDALKAANENTAQVLNATDTNLAAFKARGGKLILYHGWNDPAISALNTINYYDSVRSRTGWREADAFVRVFMAPGMQHCGGGPGPFVFGQNGAGANDPQHNIEMALERWVEKGTAPSEIVATKYVDDDPAKRVKMTRPLCAYPQVAKYKGKGDSNDASNFTCVPGSK